MPKISVIIPVYNAGDFILKSSDSVLSSTFKDLELILVNDGSTDGSGDVCESIKAKDERVIVVHKKNGGISSARNAGMKVATGDYITFVDQDDSISPEMYEVLYNNAVKDFEGGRDISLCNFMLIYPDHTTIYKTYDVQPTPEQTYKAMLLAGYGGQVWNMIMKRNIVVDNDVHFPEHLRHCEDTFFSYRLHLYANSYVKTEKPLYYYNLNNPNQVSNHLDWRFHACACQCIEETLEYLSSRGVLRLYQKEFMYLMLQLKADCVFNISKFGEVNSWHPEVNDLIDECPLLGNKMKVILKHISKKHYLTAICMMLLYKASKKIRS